MEEKTNIGFRYGLVAGVALIVAYLILFYTDPGLLFRRMGMLAFAIMLVVMIGAGRMTKRQMEGSEMVFRELVRPVFTVFVVSMAVIVVFHYVFYNFFDSNMATLIKEWFMQEGKRQMELADKSSEYIAKEMDLLQNGDYSYGVFKALQTYVLSLVFGFLMAASIAVGFMYVGMWKEEVGERLTTND